MQNRRSFFRTLGGSIAGTFVAGDLVMAATRQPVRAPRLTTIDGLATSLTGPIKIGSNENPYGPPVSVINALHAAGVRGNRYPGAMVDELVSAIAASFTVPPERVMLSGGSVDLLRAIVSVYTGKAAALVTATPSYEPPTLSAQRLGARIRVVPVTAQLRLDLPTMAAAGVGAGLVYICNPNNPTSTTVPLANIEELAGRIFRISPKTMVVVDEAYFEYADSAGFGTAVSLIDRYPNVIVIQTMSKIHAMAGMRVGYAIAQPKVIATLRANYSASGLSVMSLAAAMASLNDTTNIQQNVRLNREARAATVQAFQEVGYNVADSDASFVFVNIGRDAGEFQDICRDGGVLVGRPFPPLNNWSRISIGTRTEMDRAMDVMLAALAKPPAPRRAGFYLQSMEGVSC